MLDCDQQLKLWLSVSPSAQWWTDLVIIFFASAKNEYLVSLVCIQYSVAKTSQTISWNRVLDMLRVSSCWAVTTVSVTFTWIRDLTSSLLIVVTRESALVNVSQIPFSLIPAWLSLWTISSRADGRRSGFAAPAAVLVVWTMVFATKFIVVRKDALSVRSARLGYCFQKLVL